MSMSLGRTVTLSFARTKEKEKIPQMAMFDGRD